MLTCGQNNLYLVTLKWTDIHYPSKLSRNSIKEESIGFVLVPKITRFYLNFEFVPRLRVGTVGSI